MSVTTRKMTAEELFHMPHGNFRYELVKGELRKMSPSGSRHGAVVVNLTILLGQHVKAKNLGVVLGAETGFQISSEPDTVRAPDVAFVRRGRIGPAGIPGKFWPGAPDLAVEVLSPSDTAYTVEEKVDDWLAAGTGAVWVANPRRRTVTIHRSKTPPKNLSEEDVLDGQDLVPGFRCKVAEIFA